MKTKPFTKILEAHVIPAHDNAVFSYWAEAPFRLTNVTLTDTSGDFDINHVVIRTIMLARFSERPFVVAPNDGMLVLVDNISMTARSTGVVIEGEELILNRKAHCWRDPSIIGCCNGPDNCSCECTLCTGNRREEEVLELIAKATMFEANVETKK